MISAAQVPRARDDLARYFGTKHLIGMILAKHITAGGNIDLPLPEMKATTPEAMFDAYERRLTTLARAAELFHVTAEMTAVADSARRTMPGYRLHRDDLPAETGLILFDTPIGSFDIEGDPELMSKLDRQRVEEARQTGEEIAPAVCVGAMWGQAVNRDGQPGVLVVTLCDNYQLVAYRERRYGSDEALQLMRSFGALGYHDEAVLPYGEWYEEVSGPDEPIRNEALGTLLATWLLMGQPIVTVQAEPLPRQARRAYERMGNPVPAVRVVRLRHPKQAPREDVETGTGREYRNRWVVRGHWRNQWYPSRQDHRPVYVPSYVKGPEGAPLLTTDRVYDWRR